MNTNNFTRFFVLSALLFIESITAFGQSDVQLYEKKLNIKTYINNPADVNPIFYDGLGHQGVQKHVYPYPQEDGLSDLVKYVDYMAVYLENKYIKISVIPELGGRIFSALNKSDNYNFIYTQHVIKPSLIGMAGSWISGAIAWGFPHHHGPLTMSPFEYTPKLNEDGSKTIWVAKTDLRHRMRMLLGITVYPDKSYIEVSTKLFNSTPLSNSMLFWANPSVIADSSYQVTFGPSVQWATFHHKSDFIKWPVGDSIFQGIDYKGIDVSWWKIAQRPTSFFSWDSKDDFFSGYSHAKKSGIGYIGNHYTLPGMKLWEHGSNPEGDMWKNMLTDNDGHYIELMAGAYTDNQPDYSWMQPYEVKTFKQYWFPIRDLEGMKFANLNGAMGLEITKPGEAIIRLNATSENKNAKIVLEVKNNPVYQETINISPADPFNKTVKIDVGTKETDLCVKLLSSKGELLIKYRPQELQPTPKPKTVQTPKIPAEIKSVEELYLTGLRINQFYNSTIDPAPYYEEALKRDPGNSGVNTQLGILLCKRKMWTEAEQKLRTAVNRVTMNYTRAKDCESLYYLGLALRAQGKNTEAYDYFYRATWDYAWHSAAYFQLASMDCVNKDFEVAIDHIQRAYGTNNYDPAIRNLEAAIYRKAGKSAMAEKIALELAQNNLLDFQSRNELYLLNKLKGNIAEADKLLNELKIKMRNDHEEYLELAVTYGNSGMYDEAIDILSRIDRTRYSLPSALADGASKYPMVYYYLGYYWNKKVDSAKAKSYYQTAATMPWEYCFPYRDESIDVLKSAQQMNPSDAMACYYLGNLLGDHQPMTAIQQWEKTIQINSKFSSAYRNLSWEISRYGNDLPKAIQYLETAIQLNNKDPRYFYELDMLYEKTNTSVDKRLKMLEANKQVVLTEDNALSRLALVYSHNGKYSEAINILTINHFNLREGSRVLRTLYEDTYQLRGLQEFLKGNYNEALNDFKQSYEYPKNLDSGRPPKNRRFAQTFYLIGLANEKLGNNDEANKYFQRAIDEEVGESEYLFFRGLAQASLGNNDKASETFKQLAAISKQPIQNLNVYISFTRNESEDFYKAKKHYMAALAGFGQGDKALAKEELKKSLELNPVDLWANFFINNGFN